MIFQDETESIIEVILDHPLVSFLVFLLCLLVLYKFVQIALKYKASTTYY